MHADSGAAGRENGRRTRISESDGKSLIEQPSASRYLAALLKHKDPQPLASVPSGVRRGGCWGSVEVGGLEVETQSDGPGCMDQDNFV